MNSPRPSAHNSRAIVIRYELLSIISMLIVQFIAAVACFTTMMADVRYTRADVSLLRAELVRATSGLYKLTDAERDFFAVSQRFERTEKRIDRLEGLHDNPKV